jgi:hypothetical protein
MLIGFLVGAIIGVRYSGNLVNKLFTALIVAESVKPKN